MASTGSISSSNEGGQASSTSLTPSQQEALNRMAKMVNAFLARPDSGPFREPVDWRGLELFDYPQIIKRMMDLGTVKRKLDRKKYKCAAEVAFDIRLVWKNCMTYNAEGSDFWLLAKGYSRRFEDRYRRIRNEFDVGEEPIIESEEGEEEEESEGEDGDEDHVEGSSNRRSTSNRPRSRASSDQEDEEHDFDEDGSERSGGTDKRSSTPPPPKLDARARFAANLLLLNGVELAHVISKLEKICPQALEQGPSMMVPEQLEIVIDKIDGETFSTVSQYAAEKAQARKRSRLNNNQMVPNNTMVTTPTAAVAAAAASFTAVSSTHNSSAEPSPQNDLSTGNSGSKKKRKR